MEKHSWITVFGADARNGSSRDKVVAPPWVPGRRMTEVGVPDRAQSLGQHVTQIALHEFGARQGEFASAVVVRAVLPAEGDQEIRGVHPVWPIHVGSTVRLPGDRIAGRAKRPR